MAVVVVNEVEFGVVKLRRPLEGLDDAVFGGRDGAERSVGIRRADVTVRSEKFADVFRDVVAVSEPSAVIYNITFHLHKFHFHSDTTPHSIALLPSKLIPPIHCLDTFLLNDLRAPN